jgi:hypothetical protein
MQGYIYTQLMLMGEFDTQHTNETSSYKYSPNKLNESILFRRAKIMELNNAVSISMKINGNTTIAAGQTINLTVPVSGRIHEKDHDEYYSGRYLITKLRHSFSQTDKKHEILLTASKDSFGKELPIGSKAIGTKRFCWSNLQSNLLTERRLYRIHYENHYLN